jgi:tetratricopeptide (TPR) repeat protein
MTRIFGAVVCVALLMAGVLALRALPDEPILEILLVKTKPEADAILAKIQAGESFELLASRHSIDPTAPDGGYLGQIKTEYLKAELKEALKNVGVEGVTSVFPASGGYMILKVLARPREAALGQQTAAQLVAYVAGFEEALSYFSKMPKPDNYHQDLKTMCDLKKRAVEVAIQEMEAVLGPGRNAQQRLQAHHTIAQLSAYQGNMDKAIRHFEEAFQIATENSLNALVPVLREKLAIAYLRKGEVENCVANHSARSCIYPLTLEARHKLQAGSRKAVSLFTDYLREQPDDLEVKWLLNLALMTLGPPSKDIPGAYLLPQPAFKRIEGVPEFVDVAHSAGIHRMNNAGGSIMEDFDNDGWFDIVLSVVDACEPMSFYHNNGDGTFSDRTKQAGLLGQLGGINTNQTDYNNDGALDIFVMRGGWEFPMRNSLLRNNGDGTFTDVTAEAGLALPAYPTPTAAWADYDNDGFVDLFIGNENGPGQLFRNKGDGTFVDVAAAAGVQKVAFTKGAVWGDYDNDGFPDLYVSNYGQPNFLYHNNRDGTFTDVAKALGVEKPIFSFPTWFFDYDNDGCLDLFVSSYVQSVAEVAAEYLKYPVHAETMKLYRNNCRGGFEDVTRQVGLDRVSMAMGSNFGDIDNDGFLDFYLGTGSPSYGALVPNLLFRNQDGKRFVDVTVQSGTGHLQKGHGIAFGDYDGDGDQDIFLHVGGAVPGDTYNNVLFRNPGNGAHWLRVKLVGRKTNRAAIGARIKAVIVEPNQRPRAVHRVVTSGGSFGASSFQQNIGMGRADRVKTLEIWWPTSGIRQTFRDIVANQAIEIVETQNSYKRLAQ